MPLISSIHNFPENLEFYCSADFIQHHWLTLLSTPKWRMENDSLYSIPPITWSLTFDEWYSSYFSILIVPKIKIFSDLNIFHPTVRLPLLLDTNRQMEVIPGTGLPLSHKHNHPLSVIYNLSHWQYSQNTGISCGRHIPFKHLVTLAPRPKWTTRGGSPWSIPTIGWALASCEQYSYFLSIWMALALLHLHGMEIHFWPLS